MFADELVKRKLLLDKINTSFDDKVNAAVRLVSDSIRNDNFLFFAGNGGSAAEAQHMSAEYLATLDHRNFRPGFKSIALTVDTSFITAWTNDFGYEAVFLRQLQTLASPNDTFFAYSTSGTSENVIKAIEYAKENKIKTVGFSGNEGGVMKDLCGVSFVVPSASTAMIQEVHTILGHVICGLVEKEEARPNV